MFSTTAGSQRFITLLIAVLAATVAAPIDAAPIAIGGSVSATGTVTPGATAATNPAGSPMDEVQLAIEIGLEPIYALFGGPGAQVTDAQVTIRGLLFGTAKTMSVFTYEGDLQLTAADFDALPIPGQFSDPIFEYAAPGAIPAPGVDVTFDITSDLNLLLTLDALAMGFNLRESPSSGNFIVAFEYLFVATTMVGSVEVSLSSVPEPASLLLLCAGLSGLALIRRRGKSSRH